MRQDERTPFVEALGRARLSAYEPGEFVGQESFMRAGEILDLARRADVGPAVRLLDLCCGVAGPGRLVAARLGCADYLGLDYSASAIEIARRSAGDLPCRFEVAQLPPLPAGVDGPYDVVMLLETFLAFEDKATLLAEVARVLAPGGRFALTLEEGTPLGPREREQMPDADTVWLTPLPELVELLHQVDLDVTWQQDVSQAHLSMVDALLHAFRTEDAAIVAHVGRQALDELVAAHQLWSEWLRSGRVRKFALVARKL